MNKHYITALLKRLNRKEGIAKAKKDDKMLKLIQMLKECDEETLYKHGELIAPVIGTDKEWFARALWVHTIFMRDNQRMQSSLRSIIADLANLYNLPRKAKDIIADSILKGRIKTTGYYYNLMLVIDRILSDKQNPEYENVNFNKLLNIVNFSKENGGNLFDLVVNDSTLDEDTKKYFKKIHDSSNVIIKNIEMLLDCTVYENSKRSSTPIAMNGYLSKYRNNTNEKNEKKIGANVTYDQAIAQAAIDMALFAGADSLELKNYAAMQHLRKKEREESD